MGNLTIDTTALTAEVSQEDKQRYRPKKGSGCSPIGILMACLVPLLFVAFVMQFFMSGGGIPTPVLIIGGIVAVVVIGAAVIGTLTGGKRRVQRYKFAEANGFIYHETESTERLRGVLFTVGRSQRNSEVFQMHGNVRLGNYQYTTGSGKNSTTHYWRYVEVPLPRNLPHLVLDSNDNNSIFGSNLPVSLHKSQRMELEGDFSNYFTLYAPDGYDFDVRYLLPPDTMALLIDNLQQFDMEFVDDRLILIANGSWSLHDNEPWAFAEWVINVLHPHVVDRTDRYLDERVAQQNAISAPAQGNGSAPQQAVGTVSNSGRRLRRAFPIGTIIFFVVIGAIVLLPRLLN